MDDENNNKDTNAEEPTIGSNGSSMSEVKERDFRSGSPDPNVVEVVQPGEATVAAGELVLEAPSVHSSTTPEERKRGMIVLFTSLIIVGMGHSIVFNILPPLARKMGYQEWQVTTIFAVSAFCWVF